MAEIRVVAVEPEYQVNLGYIARISKNFGVKSLVLVNPKCRHNGKNAIKYSKHAHELLERAKVCKTLDEAVKGTFAIGTTAIWHKTNASLYNVYSLEQVQRLLKKNMIGKVSIVLGREGTGLTREELRICPATISIQTPGSYNVLNISHALAIILYQLAFLEKGKIPETFYAGRDDIRSIMRLFRMMLDRKKNIRSRDTVSRAFEHMLLRSRPTKKELGAIAIALSERE